jgi:hypothetical protein
MRGGCGLHSIANLTVPTSMQRLKQGALEMETDLEPCSLWCTSRLTGIHLERVARSTRRVMMMQL